jgi:hypothetical protein
MMDGTVRGAVRVGFPCSETMCRMGAIFSAEDYRGQGGG